MFIQDENSIEDLFQLNSLQTIVDEVGSLIKHDLVICNRRGVIIAATQRDRIGITNENVREMIESNGEQHIVPVSNNESFFRPGINLPVRYEKSPVGAVGITGNPDEVQDFGRLIQAMVQQQLQDLVYQRNLGEKKRIISDFVYSWLYKGSSQKKKEFMIRSRSLGIDINVLRVICIIDTRYGTDGAVLLDKTADKIYQLIENRLTNIDKKNVVTVLDNRITVLLHTDATEVAHTTMEHLRYEINRTFRVLCPIGISNPFVNIDDAKTQYEVAKQACRIAAGKASKSIVIFNSYDLEPLISSIKREDRKRVYGHFFRNYHSSEQIYEALHVLECYIDCNRSITGVAKRLNLHKNTVQFRLDKIRDLTGYNPREARELAYMYLIILIHKLGSES